MVKGYSRLAVVLGLAALWIATPGAQNRPLPDQDAFLKETRKHLQTDSSVQSSYMYVETCLLYTSPSPRDGLLSRMPSSA